jgi:acyl-coenzyme A synthetase/AMP-(fatty) acid ligase
MVSQLRTHLTTIEEAYNKSPQAAAFRIAKLHPTTGKVDEWLTMSYAQFRGDILAQATYWSQFLQSRNIQPGSVVTLWLHGMDYNDATLIFGLSRAGYILLLVSFSLPTTEGVYNLAEQAESKFIVYDSSKKDLIDTAPSPIPDYCRDMKAHQELLRKISPSEEGLPLLHEMAADPNAVVFIVLTSGSTYGPPKQVPWTYQWIDHNIAKYEHTSHQQSVNTWIGSICHAGQLLASARAFLSASTIVQPSSLGFDSDELIDMAHRCSLTILTQFPSFFILHLQRARKDPALVKVLQGLSAVFLGGMALSDGDIKWCVENDVPLQFSFASTETGGLLRSAPGKPPTWFQPTKSSSLRFKPVEYPQGSADGNEGSSEQPQTQKLFELVVLSDSKDCPVPSLRSPEDGHFHTGDLFEEVAPGFYESRGRADDWIKLLWAGRCDARCVEDNTLTHCRDLIHSCIVTGSYRPSIVLFVEPHADTNLSQSELQEEILRRIAPTQVHLFEGHKIVNPRQVYVVPMGSLPRTTIKGNIRRKAVEELYKKELDDIYEAIKKA